MSLQAEARPIETLAFRLFRYFQRIVAAICLAAGLQYWALLSGLYGGALWRFDLMPMHWQVAASSLAVLFPVAAVGLWMPVSWGPVIWFVAAAAEVAMYLVFSDLFGLRPLIVAMHAGVAVIYTVFRLILHYEKLRSREPVRVDSL